MIVVTTAWKTQTPHAHPKAYDLAVRRRGDGIRGTTRLHRVLADPISKLRFVSAELHYGSPPAEPTQTMSPSVSCSRVIFVGAQVRAHTIPQSLGLRVPSTRPYLRMSVESISAGGCSTPS
jgi:hypothetical protein